MLPRPQTRFSLLWLSCDFSRTASAAQFYVAFFMTWSTIKDCHIVCARKDWTIQLGLDPISSGSDPPEILSLSQFLLSLHYRFKCQCRMRWRNRYCSQIELLYRLAWASLARWRQLLWQCVKGTKHLFWMLQVDLLARNWSVQAKMDRYVCGPLVCRHHKVPTCILLQSCWAHDNAKYCRPCNRGKQ